MLAKLLGKVFGTKTERELKRLWPIVDQINEIFPKFNAVDLQKTSEDLKKRIQQGEPLDDILPEAFALVKEACRRLVDKAWKMSQERQHTTAISHMVQTMNLALTI